MHSGLFLQELEDFRAALLPNQFECRSRKVSTQDVTLQKSGRELKNTDYWLIEQHVQQFSDAKYKEGLRFSAEGSFDSSREFLVYLQIKKQEQL